MQSIEVFIFVLINVVLCAASYRSFLHNIYWDSNALQLWRNVSDRAGIIAYANLPFVWLFAGRNNIFLWLTGWSYGTYNVFHRWVARVVVVEAIVHSIGCTAYTWSGSGQEALQESYPQEYWYTGIISTVTMSFILIFSVLPLRKKLYELFLELHVVLALIALICLFYHTKDYDNSLYENPFLWPCAALWCFDYAVRLARLLVLNWKLLFFSHTKAVAVYDEKQDLIRLNVTPSFHLKPQPGTHYFLYFPTLLLAKGNHPFTMSHWTVPGTLPASSPPSPGGDILKEETVVSSIPASRDSSLGSINGSGATQTSIQFPIRPYTGLNGYLRKTIRASNTPQKELTVLIEGPYGHPAPVFDFHTIIFVAGGTGITPILAYMQEYLTKATTAKIMTCNVHIVWAAREADFVRGVLNHELRAARGKPNVQICIYLTRDQDDTHSKGSPVVHEEYQWATFHHGRPIVQTVIRDAVDAAVSTVAVLACGPAGLADEARATMAAVAASGIEYFEEQFGWQAVDVRNHSDDRQTDGSVGGGIYCHSLWDNSISRILDDYLFINSYGL